MKKLLVFITTFITIFALCINTIAPINAQSRTPQTETVTPKPAKTTNTSKHTATPAKAPKLTATKSATKPATKPATKHTKSTHRRKQILANNIYPRTTTVPTKTNVISFDGKDLPVGDFT